MMGGFMKTSTREKKSDLFLCVGFEKFLLMFFFFLLFYLKGEVYENNQKCVLHF